MQKFVKVTDDMVANNLNIARYLIADLKMGYKHHNLNCITFTPGFRSICGFSLPQFTQLLNFIKPGLLKVLEMLFLPPLSKTLINLRGPNHSLQRIARLPD